MTTDTLAWPVKTGDVHNAFVESAVWDRLVFRDDDIVIATYPKCGTTLTQQLVAQLVFDADPTVYGAAITVSQCLEMHPPGVDLVAIAEALTHRRILKTHLPVSQLTYSPKARYITIGRDARDIAWSFHNHLRGMQVEKLVEMSGNASVRDLLEADPDVRVFYHRFIEEGAHGMPFWPHIQGWWDIRRLPNLLTLHYADLLADMPGQIRKVAAFLDIPLDEARLPMMVEHCSIAHMRKVAAADEGLNFVFDLGAERFINKGTNGRWRDVLTQAEIDRCDEIAARELTPECAAWLRNGALA